MGVYLDKIDFIVLKALMLDGRASYSTIAKQTNLTDVAIKKRVESLKRRGVLSTIAAQINFQALGYEKPLFLQLRTDLSKTKDLVKRVESMDNVVEVYHVLGEYNLLMQVILPELNAVDSLLAKLSSLDGVQDIKSMVVVSKLKASTSLPSTLMQKKL